MLPSDSQLYAKRPYKSLACLLKLIFKVTKMYLKLKIHKSALVVHMYVCSPIFTIRKIINFKLFAQLFMNVLI